MAKTLLNLRAKLTPSESLEWAITSFLARCEARNLSPHTLRFYRVRLDAFRQYLREQELAVAPEDMTPVLLRDFLTWEQKRLSVTTAADAYATLSALFRHLKREEYITQNPLEHVARPKEPQRVIESFTPKQIEQLFGVCTGHNFVPLRNKAIILVLLDCGLRVSELCTLTLEDIRWDASMLKVTGKGNKQRFTPFGKVCSHALKEYTLRRGDLDTEVVFVSSLAEPLSRQAIYHTLRDLGERAGVPNVHPHKFRHTCALLYLKAGGDAFSLQRLLGHTDISVTRRYVDMTMSDVAEQHKRYGPVDAHFPDALAKRERKRMQ